MKRTALIVLTFVFSLLVVPSAPLSAQASQIMSTELPSLILVTAESQRETYDRDRFRHWIDEDGDGCNTRYEVLIAMALTSPTVNDGCTLVGGEWLSPYDNVTTADPSKFDIDHMVPLAEAWRSGAFAWTDEERRAFANDLDVPYALLAVSASSNRSKSDRDPANWLPSNTDYICEYLVGWTLTKYRWQLTADPTEHAVISQVLGDDCGGMPVTLPAVMPVTTSDTSEPSPVPTPPVVPAPTHTTTIAPIKNGVSRLAGNDRYETAVAASKSFAKNVPVAYVATGADFPDALSAAAAAAKLGGPLLLTPKNSIPTSVFNELKRLNPEVIYIVGGDSVVSSAVLNRLQSITTVQRLSGSDRYTTGEQIVRHAFGGNGATTVFIATGRDFPDALAATGAASSIESPVILVNGSLRSVPASTLRLLNDLGTTNVVLVGGESVVSSGIHTQLRNQGYELQRRGGANRFETAAAVNSPYFSAGSTDVVFMATAFNFPDALAGAALAGQVGAPMYIAQQNCTHYTVYSSVKGLKPEATVALGGSAVLSNRAASNTTCNPERTAPPASVSGGAFCAKNLAGMYGPSRTGKLLQCATSSSDSRFRWR